MDSYLSTSAVTGPTWLVSAWDIDNLKTSRGGSRVGSRR